MAAEADDLGVELVEQRLEVGAVLGQGLVEEGAQVLRGGGDEDGAIAQAGIVIGDAIEGGGAEGADLVGREGEAVFGMEGYRKVQRDGRRGAPKTSINGFGRRELYLVWKRSRWELRRTSGRRSKASCGGTSGWCW